MTTTTIDKYTSDQRATETALSTTTAALAAADARLRDAKRALESSPADVGLLDATVEAEAARLRAAAQHEATRARFNSHREVWLRDHRHEVEAELASVEAQLEGEAVRARLAPIAGRVAKALRALGDELEALRALDRDLEALRAQRNGLAGLLGRPVFAGDHFDLARMLATVNVAARAAAGLRPSSAGGDGPAFGDDAAHLVLEWPRWSDLGDAVASRLARLGAGVRGVQAAAEADAAKIGGAS